VFGQADECTAAVIRPVMESAGEPSGRTSFLVHHEGAPMATRVDHGDEGAVVRAGRDDRNTEVAESEERSRRGKVAGETDDLRVMTEKRVPLPLGEIGIGVDGSGIASDPAFVDVDSGVESSEHLLDQSNLSVVVDGFAPSRLNCGLRLEYTLNMSPKTAPVNTVVGLRDRNKAKRRDAILDSTMALLAELPIDNVTIDRIAAHAELAPATVYNLMGSREEVMAACINRVLEGVVDRLLVIDIDADPIAAASAVVDYCSAAFLDQGTAFRQVIGEINTFSLGGLRLSFDPGQLQIAAMKAAQQRGILRPDINATAVGRQIYLSFTGALHAWAAGRLSDDGVRAAVWHGLWSAVAAGASSEHRARFLRELRKSGAALAKAGYARS